MNYLRGILGFVYKIYIAVLFCSFLLLYYLPIVLSKRSPKTKKLTFVFFTAWSWSMRIFGLIFVRYERRVALPEGPYIIISNHASYFDIFLMYSLFPKHEFLFLGKAEILNYPLVKSFFKDLNIPVFRKDRLKAAKSFIIAKQAIKDGWSLVVFPEGGIPDDNLPQMKPFKDGAFKLAKSAKVPLVPVTFLNNYKLFSDPDSFLGPASPGICKVYQHDIITVDLIKEMSEQELKNYCYGIIDSPLKKYA
ncbi:MAG: phospholipid/glycerol acyltransferase [Crocinitomicaceae bacterium]|jgi:1-acyl-sn-glycerol-3-phosphate acyltransferase|nr:phospholipid/glycerol acyltransferase [Crocinitomicaceae bacterium]